MTGATPKSTGGTPSILRARACVEGGEGGSGGSTATRSGGGGGGGGVKFKRWDPKARVKGGGGTPRGSTRGFACGGRGGGARWDPPWILYAYKKQYQKGPKIKKIARRFAPFLSQCTVDYTFNR